MENSNITKINWPDFHVGAGSLSSLEKTILGSYILLSSAKVILEFGSFKGLTTRFIVEFCQVNQIEAKIFAFDVPEVASNLSKLPEFKTAIESGMLTFVGGYLPHSLVQWKKDHNGLKVDLVLDDALHSYKSVWDELNLVWPILSDGGYVLCHHYCYKYEGVRLAVNKFAKSKDAHIQPLVSKNTFNNDSDSTVIHKSVLVSLSKKSDYLKSNIGEILSVRKFYLKKFLAETGFWKFVKPYVRT